MNIIMDIFFIVICVVFFMWSLFNLSKALNGNHKIGDKVCIIFMIIAFITAIAIIAGSIDLIRQVALFVRGLL